MAMTLRGMSCCALGLALGAGLLLGCASAKPYPNTLAKNLQIRTETKSGSFFTGVRADVLIYRVDAPCRTEYEGLLELNAPSLAVGIPSGRLSYLVFKFASSSFLASTRSSISQATLLKPRPGYRYYIDVSDENNIYNVVVHENRPGMRAGREIALSRLEGCNASSPG